jgi:hypothetical protein
MPLPNKHSTFVYSPPNVEYELVARQLGPDDKLDRDRVRWQDFHRQYVETGLWTEEKAQEYADTLDAPPAPGNFRPTDALDTGVFKRDGAGEELVAVQNWGISSYPAHELTDHLWGMHVVAGQSDPRPAYVQNRMVAEPRKGFGTVVRHASALVMQANNFAIVGHKLSEADWKGHVDEIEALDPVLIRRSESSVASPVTPIDAYATQRTEVYVGVPLLLQALESHRPWLAEVAIVGNMAQSNH